MIEVSQPHSQEDELQTISISNGGVEFHLHFEKQEKYMLDNLISTLQHFMKNPMDWYIGMHYIESGGDFTCGLGYQNENRTMQIGFNGADIWLFLTKKELLNIINKLKNCSKNLS